ncbi:site-specific integrase [Corynebacterium diphtheriae]|nr:site-specific integrase [Corynebacterium diphtheriae]CAB0988565.1 site-specific integrase [Corynebacterium diphtheriae]CAB1007085.1 site-specific integrase [Corynebacterium diphtheriae]
MPRGYKNPRVVPDNVERVISAYTPVPGTLAWGVVWEDPFAEFVRECARDLGLPATASDDVIRGNLRLIASFVAWVIHEYDCPLRRDEIFDYILAEAYAMSVIYVRDGHGKGTSNKVRGIRRSMLTKIGWKMNKHFGEPHKHALPQEGALEPYKQWQLNKVDAWAGSQPNERRRRNARVAIALALGAGLRTSEIAGLTADDCEVTDSGMVLIHAPGYRGGEPRITVVDHRFEDTITDRLAELADLRAAGEPGQYLYCPHLLGRTTDMVNDYMKKKITSSGADCYLQPDLRRLRNTWITGHIKAGVEEGAICQAAGLKSLNQFRDLVDEAAKARAEQSYARLRGGEHRPVLRLVQG